MKIQLPGLFILLLLLTASLSAQEKEAVTFEAQLSKDELGINERLRIDFTMNRDGDNFNPPDFKGFRVVMGPLQNISSSWVNGVRSYSKTYSYTLAPTARGSFTIGQATIEIGGKVYKSLPKKVTVTAAVDKPSTQKTADDIAEESLHLVAEVSKTDPYLNEAVSVVYKLYVSPSVNVSNYRPLDNPKYNNFWSQDIPVTRLEVKNGTYDGKPFRYVVLKRVVLYPQKSGDLEIEPLSLDVTVDVPTNQRDFFGGRVYTQTNRTVSAGKRTLQVKPLPDRGKPDDFSGAVGDFNFSVTTSKKVLKASESLQAIVEVRGKGNLKLFPLPELNLPGSLEVYDPEFNEQVRVTLSGMQGTVRNNYTVVPAYQGKYPVPSISFTFFNPEKGRYETITSDEILIEVDEGPVRRGTDPAVPSNTGSQVVSGSDQFHFIKTRTNLKPKQQDPFFGSLPYFGWLFGILASLPLILLIGRRRQALADDVEGNRLRRANRLARRYLGRARKVLGDKDAFYVALEKALHNYLKAKLKITTSDFSKDRIARLLSDRGIQEATVSEFISLLKNCELARYSPFSQVQMEEDYDRAARVISSLDKQL